MNSTTFRNMTFETHRNITPSTTVEIRAKTYADKDTHYSSIKPTQVTNFGNLENALSYFEQQDGIIQVAWNLINDNTFYTTNGKAG